MSDDPFEGRDYVEFTIHEGQVVSLHRETWQRKVDKHDYVVFNYEKIARTLENPDQVVRSTQYRDSLLYYKEFGSYCIRKNVEVPAVPGTRYFVVVVSQGVRIQTFFFTPRIKPGDIVWPPTD